MARPRNAPRASAPRGAAVHVDALELYHTMTAYNRFQQFRDRDHSGYHGLTLTQCYVLEHLERKQSLTLNDLARELLLDKSTLSRVVDKLESKGAIVRRPHPTDGRSSLIRTTAAGARAYRNWVTDRVRENEELLGGLTARQRRQLLDFLARLTRLALTRHIETVEE